MKLLFIPGAACGKKAWLCQAQYFSGSEAVSLPGHPEGKPCASVDEYTAWLRDYLRERQYQDIVLAGHSMGGAVAQCYGLKYPEGLKALILIATGAKLRIHPDLMEAVRGMINDRVRWREYLEERHRNNVPEAKGAIIEERLRIGPAVMLNDYICCDNFNIMSEVPNIRLPTLIIGGSDDDLTPVKFAHYLKRQIRGAQELIVSGAGHWVLAERPAEVNQAIATFLAGLG